MTVIPAMCENGHYYLDREHVGINPGQRLMVENVRAGRCPVCGADAQFENGTYYEAGTFWQRVSIAARAVRAIIRP